MLISTLHAQDHFERSVRPILATKCYGCHGAEAKLDFTSRAGLEQVAAKIEAVTGYTGRIKMPPGGKLSEPELAAIRAWVWQGAPLPAVQAAVSKERWWSFQTVQAGTPPAVRNGGWVRSPIDRFVLAKLEAAKLEPAAPASGFTWLRRVSFDLTGLPPNEDETREFLASGDRAKLIDRLLASPRYGEKWGRHWLDVARYADSTGADEDYRYPHAWRYRDYVIEAFNKDLPYDQFVREQIAGDLLNPPNGAIATGFLALGPKLVAEQDKVKMFYDIVDEQIDTMSKAVLGLTIACARCHDHKFDPISTKDYYSLASIFASTKQLAKIEGTVSQLYFVPLVAKEIAEKFEAHQELVAAKQKEIDGTLSGEGTRYRDANLPKIAANMLLAYKVYAEGQPAANHEVQRWADYLKPSNERRVHLERWYQSTDRETAARAYQEEIIEELARRKRLQAEAKAADKEAPRFLAGDHRLYTELTTGKGPLTLPEKDRESFLSDKARTKLDGLRAELAALKAAAPPEPPMACGVGEDKAIDQPVFLRGNVEAKGEIVPKRFPKILSKEASPVSGGSGRRELAEFLASPDNPLTARVMVNRIWQGHFGQGLVRTPNNFGTTGEPPTHPELLDWLAAEFVRGGWSVKAMHRLILLSSTYAMSGTVNGQDPDNRLLSHFPMRRKTVEEIRDSLLLIDDSLDLTMGGALQSGKGTDNEFSDARKSIHPDSTNRRSVYLPIRRSNLSTLFTLFDFGDGTTSTETRAQTTVAPQALYMMNSKFVEDRAANLAKRLQGIDAAGRILTAWRKILGREPSVTEREAAQRFLDGFPGNNPAERAWASLCRSLIASNDFLYVH